jgi:hypothetical protein
MIWKAGRVPIVRRNCSSKIKTKTYQLRLQRSAYGWMLEEDLDHAKVATSSRSSSEEEDVSDGCDPHASGDVIGSLTGLGSVEGNDETAQEGSEPGRGGEERSDGRVVAEGRDDWKIGS